MRTKGLAGRLLANWPAKVLSLAAALLLFVFYRLNRLEDRYISVPLAVSMNEEYVPASQYPRSVRVTLHGESNSLFKIQEDDIGASLDLSGIRGEGVFRVPVQVDKRGTALGIDPLELKVEPVDVAMAMERKAIRLVPVTPSFRGFLEPGFELVSFELNPSQVEIYGPASAVARVADVATESIELAGRNVDFSVTTRFVQREGLVYVAGPATVGFKAVVQKSLAVRNLESIQIEARGLDPALAILLPLPAGSASIRSAGADISAYRPGPGLLSADLSGVKKAGSYDLPVSAIAPEGYTVERYEPRTVTVVVEDRKEAKE
jgi:hypothetical protein